MTAEIHRLRIRCSSWSQLRTFLTEKVKEGDLLMARVPFVPKDGASLVVALELPDGVTIDIGARVTGVKAVSATASAIRMHLQGLSRDLRGRLEEISGRANEEPVIAPLIQESRITSSTTRTLTGLPVPIPEDVPIDERVEPVTLPPLTQIEERVRTLYESLEKELGVLREKAAHDVLGVAWDAEVDDIRSAYFKLAKRYHPDLFSRHHSWEVTALVSEIFMHVNKAYDRLRDSLVSSGKAIVAGPALIAHNGWLVGVDDLEGDESQRVGVLAQADPMERQPTATFVRKPSAAAPTPTEGLENEGLFEDARRTKSGSKPLLEALAQPATGSIEDAREAYAKGEFESARKMLARILENSPRDRRARSLYHAAYAQTLVERGKRVEALTQLEVAFKHDPSCQEAFDARQALGREERQKRSSFFRRLFKKP